MPKVIRQFIDPVTGRHMSDIDMGNEIVSVPSQAAGLPFEGISDLGMGTEPPKPEAPTQAAASPMARLTGTQTVVPKNQYKHVDSARTIIEDEEAKAVALRPQGAQDSAAQPKFAQSSETVTENRQLSPAMEAERRNAMSSMIEADLQARDAIDAQAKQAAYDATERAEFLRLQQEQEQQRQEDVNRRVQEQLTKYQDAADEYANEKIDSKRYWSNASTADKIVAGIGLLAGAWSYGRGVTDRNYGADYINDAINRDIKEQETNLQNKKTSADMQRTLYTDLRQQGLDQEAAAAKTREMSYNILEQKLAGMATASKSEAAKAALTQQMAEFKQKAANEAMQFNTLVTRNSSRTEPMVAKVREAPVETLTQKAEAESAIENIHTLEDKLGQVVAKGDIGGITNYLKLKLKDELGIQGDIPTQEVWKGWETLLMKERAKVFGASLTESERKSFQEAITSTKAQGPQLINAIRNIRRETERLYQSKMKNLRGAGVAMPEDYVKLRIDHEDDEKRGKVKKAQSFK